jgi:protein-disulfide isomerase
MENTNSNNIKPIANAIIIAGMLITGAILLKDSSGPKAPVPIAKQIRLNMKSFNACVESGRFKEKVQADIDDGVKAGVTGTPSSFIVKDGKVVGVIGGALPYENVMEQITSILAGKTEVGMPEIKPVSAEDHIVGDINAKIIIVEYSDLDCPFCKVFHATMHRVVKDSGGDVAWVYRHYPIPQLHPNAFAKAQETECAWEQGGNEAFWKYTDKIFEVAK